MNRFRALANCAEIINEAGKKLSLMGKQYLSGDVSEDTVEMNLTIPQQLARADDLNAFSSDLALVAEAILAKCGSSPQTPAPSLDFLMEKLITVTIFLDSSQLAATTSARLKNTFPILVLTY